MIPDFYSKDLNMYCIHFRHFNPDWIFQSRLDIVIWSNGTKHTFRGSSVYCGSHAEGDSAVRRALVDVTSVVAKHALLRGEWPELLPFLHTCHKSTNPAHRADAMTLFAALTEAVPEAVQPHFDALQVCNSLLVLVCDYRIGNVNIEQSIANRNVTPEKCTKHPLKERLKL